MFPREDERMPGDCEGVPCQLRRLGTPLQNHTDSIAPSLVQLPIQLRVEDGSNMAADKAAGLLVGG